MPSGSVNMLLFDLVNTPSQEQLYAREQMLKFLKALPSGQQIALFVLTDRLHMIQKLHWQFGFTDRCRGLLKGEAGQPDPRRE